MHLNWNSYFNNISRVKQISVISIKTHNSFTSDVSGSIDVINRKPTLYPIISDILNATCDRLVPKSKLSFSLNLLYAIMVYSFAR